MISFLEKTNLFLLLFIPLIFWLLKRYRFAGQRWLLSPYSKKILGSMGSQEKKFFLLKYLPYLYLLPLALFVLALARPQQLIEIAGPQKEGIDIVIALDISGSMAALDFQPSNRLVVAKEVINRFVERRRQDRIGLVCFAANAITRSPLTYDHRIVKEVLQSVNIGDLEDGTAIGTAILTAANRLRFSERKSKVMILLTDGVNNRGEFHPLDAARVAADFGIKIYAIGVGTAGEAPYPIMDEQGIQRFLMVRVEIDEEILKEICQLTGGLYFRAMETAGLEKIMAEIDTLEKTPLKGRGNYRRIEIFPFLLFAGLLIAAVIYLLEKTYAHQIP